MTFSSRILFVDDDEDCCRMMSILLQSNDNTLCFNTAGTAREALALIENEAFDLIILDYRLPDASGVELCDQIRRAGGKMPILFYSAMAREIDRQNAVTAGANEFLVKPNDLYRIRQTIDKYLLRITEEEAGSTSNLTDSTASET